MEEHYIIKKLFEQNVDFIRFRTEQNLNFIQLRHEIRMGMMKIRYKIDIYLVIILGVMIILARAMSLH